MYETDIKSYEHRIEMQRRQAIEKLAGCQYRDALASIILILEMQASLDELRYQSDLQGRTA